MIESRDRRFLESVLRRDPVWGVYALGDLDDAEFAHTRWFASDPGAEGLVLRYDAFETTTLITFGEGAAVADVVRRLALPPRFHAHFPASHATALERQLTGSWKPYLRLGFSRGELREAAIPSGLEGRRLSLEDVPEAQRLYDHYPENWFEPGRVESGFYLGLFSEGELLAVGGTHVVSPAMGVAALGDIVTDPAHRGRGLGAALTSAMCELLFEQVALIALNVRLDNAAGRRCYEKVGFGHPVPHFEGFDIGLRSPSAGDAGGAPAE